MNTHLVVPKGSLQGLDSSVVLSDVNLQMHQQANRKFVLRYVWRDHSRPGDLTKPEVERIIRSGMGLMLVQHVLSETSWVPTRELGVAYGLVAGQAAKEVGIPSGAMIWLDLEGVAVGTAPKEVIEYCNQWHQMVAAAGFLPGLYIGWHCGLSPKQLYRNLRFTHYWAAYNLNADQYPEVRGIQMKQHEGGQTWDRNTLYADNLGSRPTLLVGDSWL